MYKKEPKNSRVICFDEFGPLEVKPYPGHNWCVSNHPDRVPATYTRPHGVRHLMATYDVHNDKLYAHTKKRKRHQEALQFLKYVRSLYPYNIKIYLVLDNFSPHKHNKVKRWARKNNVQLVFTATNASWMNRIECHFTPLKKFVFSNSNYSNHKELSIAIRKYIRWRNNHPKDKRILKEQNKTRTI